MPCCLLAGSPALRSDVPDHPTGPGGPDAALLAAADAAWARIAAGDGDIRAFMPEEGRRARLAAEAAELAQRWPAVASRPPLFGVPVGIKDVFRVDGLPTTAGSALPPDLLAGPESVAVRRVRSAGALVAGKTVTAEFAMVAPGATGNPRDLEHTPGGSSSGSAAAVAAGLVPLALGTQTIASVIRPAAYCGVAGFRPARGRIPADGVIPFAPSLDVVGCFAADLAGLVRAAAVLCSDWQPPSGPDRRPALGIPAGPYLERASPDALAAFAGQAASLAAAGYPVHQVAVLADMDQVEQLIVTITRYEAARVHARWFERYGQLYRAGTAAVIQHGRAITAGEHAGALARAAELARRLAAEAERAGIDAWITPAATGPAPHGLASTGDPVMSMPWSLAGLPALTLPAGLVGGLPVGVQVVAATGTDELLLLWAAGLEATLASRLDRPA
jgi:Asp-tRNA(Asn)/Glu-tRNA(Gln) amidotransferase A subunit family amidase